MAANHEHELGAGTMKKADVKIGGKYYANVSASELKSRSMPRNHVAAGTRPTWRRARRF